MASNQYPRQSLRQDAAMRACRDGDLTTIKLLIDQAALFEKPKELREACISGAWGAPEQQQDDGAGSTSAQAYSTRDSILLHNLLLSATTRSHATIVALLLAKFPAQRLHEAEWELIMAALGTGDPEVVKPYIGVDPELVNMVKGGIGNCFDVVFALNEEPEVEHMVEFLLEKGADPTSGGHGDETLARAEKLLPADLVRKMRHNRGRKLNRKGDN